MWFQIISFRGSEEEEARARWCAQPRVLPLLKAAAVKRELGVRIL